MLDIKIKPLTKEQIMISIDRLTRFKPTVGKYMRVFSEIITSNLIEPKYKKSDVENMDCRVVRDLAERIINYSLECLGLDLVPDYSINQQILDYENSIFQLSDDVKELLKNKINYRIIASFVNSESPKNLQWLSGLIYAEDIKAMRSMKGFCFPLEKIVLVEGITEETLLPEFARLCGYDFNKNGVYVISAGGKNQVVKYFYNLVQSCKLPIYVLLDNDALENLHEIEPKLRKCDRIHLLKSGEFEDALPENLVKKTLNFATKNISLTPIAETEMTGSRVEYLEEFFRHRGLHEFKKAEFAELVKYNIKDKNDVSAEIREIVEEIKHISVEYSPAAR